MTRVRVLIATTEGASEVQHIVEEDPEIRSVVCLDGTSEALPISAEYEAFVRKPTGIIEELYGHASYRTDVSHPISGGRSWQFGLLVAHDLYASGRLAAKGTDADEVLWVTGEVRHNLDVVGVEHVGEKLRQSAAELRATVGAQNRITVLVPEANRAETEAEVERLGLRGRLQIESMRRWHGAPARKSPRGPRRVFALVAAAAAVTAAVYGAWMWRTLTPATDLARLADRPSPAAADGTMPIAAPLPPPPPPSPGPSAERTAERPPSPPPMNAELFAVELRPPAGRTCGGQRLTGGGLVESVVDRDASGEFPHRAAAALCDVEFHVKNTGGAAQRIWLHVNPTLEGTQPRTSAAMIDPGKELSLRVGASPWQSGVPWQATVIVAVGASPVLETSEPPTPGHDARPLVDALRAAHVRYEVINYAAEAAGARSR